MKVHPVGSEKSTIVRTIRTAGLLGIRLSFQVLEWTVPGWGGRWAERLWFTVPPTRRHADVIPSTPGRAFTLRMGEATIAGQSWGEGPVVYLMHGWGGRKEHLGAFVDPLVAAGYRVVAVDATSHGDSGPGEIGKGRSTILEFTDLQAAVTAAEGPAHAVIAHSIGCMATAIAMLRGMPVRRLVFIAPMSDVRPYTQEFARRAGFGERTRRRMVARIEQRVSLDLSYFVVPAMARELAATSSLLLIHDREDKETHRSDSEDIAAAWPGAKLTITSGLGHRRIMRAPEVVEEAVAFVAAPFPAVPSPVLD